MLTANTKIGIPAFNKHGYLLPAFIYMEILGAKLDTWQI